MRRRWLETRDRARIFVGCFRLLCWSCSRGSLRLWRGSRRRRSGGRSLRLRCGSRGRCSWSCRRCRSILLGWILRLRLRRWLWARRVERNGKRARRKCAKHRKRCGRSHDVAGGHGAEERLIGTQVRTQGLTPKSAPRIRHPLCSVVCHPPSKEAFVQSSAIMGGDSRQRSVL